MVAGSTARQRSTSSAPVRWPLVAASTPITARRSVHSTVIGELWGLRLPVPVLLVGVAMIVFNGVTPPAVGRAMELAGAVMRVRPGILHRPGVLSPVPQRLPPPAPLHGHPHEH